MIRSWLRLVAFSVVLSAGLGLPAVAASSEPEASLEADAFVTGYPLTGSSAVLIDFVNRQIRQSWEDNEVEPSPLADDAEWLRRVYLDIVGHIPPADVVEGFLEETDKEKRTKVIEELLDDPGYVRNWTTIWTNLSIGRATPDRVSRMGMQRFFREAFAKNRPWNEVVYDLVSAEGHFERNGAVNYLLAQMTMPDEGVQATAKTTQLFLGKQLQCAQCHNHPFNDWKQDQFWQFNSFFRQARRVDHREYDPQTGREEDSYSELLSQDFSGPVYFEQRSGLMQVAYPTYFDEKIKEGEDTNRREELAKLMASDPGSDGGPPPTARAMVNRLWGHFFGYGFTRPVDDMGPHNPPSHPEVLDRLATEFAESGYDLKQLIRWIANSEAYNLTSRAGRGNEQDDPAAGEIPLFSRVYVKSMEAEQLYDSLIIATDAHRTGRSSWEETERRRQQWLQQFVTTFGTDENDEATTFNGTIPQALMMMNGELVQNAISVSDGSFLNRVLKESGPDVTKVQRLYVATLNRYPTRQELAKVNQLLRSNRNKEAAYQDLLWALLNSNEFIFNH